MRLFAITLLYCPLAACLFGTKLPQGLKNNWEVSKSGNGKCKAWLHELDTMWVDMVANFERLNDEGYVENEDFWLDPPEWFSNQQASWLGVSGDPKNPDPSVTEARQQMIQWFRTLNQAVNSLKPMTQTGRPLLFCGGDMMELISFTDRVPFMLNKKLQKMSDYFGGTREQFDQYWWFYVSSEKSWILLSREDYPDQGGVGEKESPFRRGSFSNRPDYCEGVVEYHDSHALTILPPTGLTNFIQNKFPILRKTTLILCPTFFQSHHSKELGHIGRGLAAADTLQNVQPAWLPWLHEILHIIQPDAQDANAWMYEGGRKLNAPYDSAYGLEKSSFKSKGTLTWGPWDCLWLSLFQRAKGALPANTGISPTLENPQTGAVGPAEALKNPESWSYFIVSIFLTAKQNQLQWTYGRALSPGDTPEYVSPKKKKKRGVIAARNYASNGTAS